MKAMNEGLGALELSLRDIDAIFLTHEHYDHIKSVGSIARKYHIPIYGSLETLQSLLLIKSLGEFDKELLHPIEADEHLRFEDFDILPFSIPHDARNPCAYRVEAEGKKVAVATDIGHFDEYIEYHLKDLDALILEANHDIRMLSEGMYPYDLKRRILSDYGHLSNENAGKLLDRLLQDRIRKVFLGHLSAENNLPDLALRTVKQEIDSSESPYRSSDFPICIAHRDRISDIVEW